MNRFAVVLFVVAISATACMAASNARSFPSAADVAFDIYRDCLKDYSIACVQPRSMGWFHQAIGMNEIKITDKLSIIHTANDAPLPRGATDDNEMLFNKIDNFLASHAMKVKAPEFFQTAEARSIIPEFLLDNSLTKGAVVPLAEGKAIEGRGFMRKVMIPFLLGLKLKTTVLVPLALALIALKTWKAMTLGLLSLVLSGALVIFKIAKPKIINYEVVHYPHHHHADHLEHLPHHVEHIVPHHVEHIVPHHVEHHSIEHVPHHIDHHSIDHVPHHVDHVDHVDHLEHPQPAWDPHAWARSSQEPQDAQEMAYAGQR